MTRGGRKLALLGPEGEEWTIQCLVLTGHDRRRTAESVAEVMCNTRGVSGRNVRIEHGETASTIYYGSYLRRIVAQTRRLEVTDAMNRDMLLIKKLGVPGQGHYFADARFVPVPTEDVGNPAWSLEQAGGVYTLCVAVFANEPGFYERKKAAAEYTGLLRKKGYPAFYRHGPIQSEVFIGEFGADAVRPITSRREIADEGSPWGVGQSVVGFEVPSAQVRALQAKETFAFELWNLKRRGEKRGAKTLYNASRLVRIQDVLDQGGW